MTEERKATIVVKVSAVLLEASGANPVMMNSRHHLSSTAFQAGYGESQIPLVLVGGQDARDRAVRLSDDN